MSPATKVTTNSNKSIIGKFILDSLSFGMYDNPLMIIREYIQNSVDAIQEYASNHDHLKINASVDITVDGRQKSVTIRDNGTGISSEKAWHVIHDLGRSEKDPLRNRGFRGIGRLGGLGYCELLRFTTKAENEDIVSTSVWDCNKFRKLLNRKTYSINASSLLGKIVTFTQEKYCGNIQDHFFSVELNQVRSSRDLLINVPAMKGYVSQVAPVPFRPGGLSFSDQIDNMLRKRVPNYETFNIKINGEIIYKPYSDLVHINKDALQHVKDIRFVELSNNHDHIAFGWFGELDLSGSILPSSLVDGIRVRCGNIQVGDKDLLSELYREKRFNNYTLGEIHIVDNRLTPNSRRDDFEDSRLRDAFHSSFIKEIGIPFSRRIRELSVLRSSEKNTEDVHALCIRANRIITRGFVAEAQKRELIENLRKINGRKPEGFTEKDIVDLIGKLKKSRHMINSQKRFKLNSSLLAKQIFELIYSEMVNKVDAERLIERISKDILS